MCEWLSVGCGCGECGVDFFKGGFFFKNGTREIDEKSPVKAKILILGLIFERGWEVDFLFILILVKKFKNVFERKNLKGVIRKSGKVLKNKNLNIDRLKVVIRIKKDKKCAKILKNKGHDQKCTKKWKCYLGSEKCLDQEKSTSQS